MKLGNAARETASVLYDLAKIALVVAICAVCAAGMFQSIGAGFVGGLIGILFALSLGMADSPPSRGKNLLQCTDSGATERVDLHEDIDLSCD